MSRLEELQSQHTLDREEWIEYVMLKRDIDRETAEEYFEIFVRDHPPLTFH